MTTVPALDSSTKPMIEVSAVALDHLDREADRGRDRDLEGLRQDHPAHLLQVAHAEAGRGLPLALGDGLDAAAPDLRQEGAGPDDQRRAGGEPGRHVEADQRQAEEDQEAAASGAVCPGRARCSPRQSAAPPGSWMCAGRGSPAPSSPPPTNAARDRTTVQRVARSRLRSMSQVVNSIIAWRSAGTATSRLRSAPGAAEWRGRGRSPWLRSRSRTGGSCATG